MAALVIDHTEQELAVWRPGNRTRLNIGAATGAEHLCLVEQWFEPGRGAPTHFHPGVEETITVMSGTGRFWCDGEEAVLDAQKTIILPPDSRHGFTNVGEDELHVFAAYSAASVPTEYEESANDVYDIGGRDGTRVDAARVKR
jgi:quercetin dioxygenase-like cupin family protein